MINRTPGPGGPSSAGHMIAELQCLPQPAGSGSARFAHVDAAIAVIAGSGLRYEVGGLGTTFEGPAAQVWDVLREAHEATLLAGARRTATVIKLVQGETHDPTIAELVQPHR